jgi:hypothetical protein
MAKDIVYKATVKTSNPSTIMNYIGLTATTYKERLANHNYTFKHKEHSNKTELSKYIWTLKDNKRDFNINWQILKLAISYTGGSTRCNLCLEGKFCILKEEKKTVYAIKWKLYLCADILSDPHTPTFRLGITT